MKMTVIKKEEIEVKELRVMAGVRYWEDAKVNGVEDESGSLIPCRDRDNWCPIINIETGIITNWTKGAEAFIHYKVCDQCGWSLIDKDGSVVLFAKDGYVPSTLCPEDNGYGDYIIMNVDVEGKISGWKFVGSDFDDSED